MRRGKKIVLSVLLTAAMLCGMLTPAFGWFVQPCRLRTPDGTFWVDVREIEYGQWTRPSDYSTTVWSQDNEVWYTTQGLAQYLQIAVVPDESWYTCTLTPEFVSPDGGQLWLCGSRRYQWQSWYDVWRYSNNEPSILYRPDDSFLMTTTPIGDDTYTVYVYDLLTDEYENGVSYCSFNVRSDPWCGVFLSTRKNLGNSWTTSLGNADWREETAYVTGDPGYLSDPANPLYTNNYCDVLNPGATFNPWQRRLNTVEYDGAAFRFTDMAHVITPMGQSNPVKQHTLFLRAARECTVRLQLSCIAQASVYGMVDLSYLRMIPESDSPLVSVSRIGGAYAAAPYGPNTQDNFLLLNGTGEPYTPVNFMGGSAEVLDSNYNGIIDEFDTLGSVTLDQTVYSSPAAEIILHLTPYNTIELPFFFWSEGQCAQAVGAVVNTDARFEVLIETLDDDQPLFEYPFEYTETEDSVTITGLSAMYLANDPNNYYYTSVYDTSRIVGLSFDPETCTLTLPSEIAGKPVTALGQFSLLEATDPMFVFDDVQLTKYDVQQIILPNTIETVGENVIGPSVERVHVPFDAVISPYSFMAQYQPLTICCDAPNSLAQQTIETAGFGQQYTFVVCTEHGTSHTHDFGDWTVTTEPTCTAAGEKTRVCSNCGAEETETVDALGHDFSVVIVQFNATCTGEGMTKYQCSRCIATEVRDYVPALGHDYDAVVTDPTCTERGYTDYTCKRCGNYYTGDYTDALGHDYSVFMFKVEPTCTSQGLSQYKCSRCDDLRITEVVNALGHDYSIVAVKEATCTTRGYTTYKCSRCNDEYIDVNSYVPALGHAFGDWTVTTEATCTAAGEKTRVCSNCGAEETETVDALGHDFSVVIVQFNATCTGEGMTKYKCSRCIATEVRDYVPALGHDYDAVVTDPTCTERGYTDYTCKRCGNYYTGDYTDALGHDYSVFMFKVEPTCTSQGLSQYKCSRCDDLRITEVVNALGHDFTIEIEKIEATCTEGGYTIERCSRCDETYRRNIAALGHDFGAWTVTTPPTHDAEGEETRECARCHITESRPVDMLVGDPYFTLSSVPARPGKTVQVQLSVEDNPGVVGAKFALTYDPQILTLTGVENGEVFGADAFQPGGNYADVPFTVFWLDALSQENYTADGVLATFTFAVAADAPGGVTPITVTYEQDSTFDAAMQPVAFSVTNGGVEVFERMAGDADGDAKTTLQDVTNLARYLAGGWGVEVDVSSADVDGDGKLTLRDLTILRRYLAGWDVVLV